MTLIEKVLFLQDVELFSALSPEQLGRIGLITRLVEKPRGKVLVREGESSDSMYIVVRGTVALESGGEQIFLAGAKEVIGTWTLLDQAEMVATATVAQDACLLRIERDDFYDLLSDHSEITQRMFQVLAARIRRLVEK